MVANGGIFNTPSILSLQSLSQSLPPKELVLLVISDWVAVTNVTTVLYVMQEWVKGKHTQRMGSLCMGGCWMEVDPVHLCLHAPIVKIHFVDC